MHVVTVPGYGGSGPEHWQTAWEEAYPSLVRFAPASWSEPDPTDWSAALDRAVADGPAVLVAHSLGCLVAADFARRHPMRIRAVFLVAVPDPGVPAFPPAARSFGARPLGGELGVFALVVASEDDPFCSSERSTDIARAWEAGWVSVGNLGHINSDSDLGEWPAGWDLFTAFAAGLGERV